MNLPRGHALRRFLDHKPAGRPLVLAADHPAVVNGGALFQARVTWPGFSDRLLKSGHHSRKIGAMVIKGPWRGMPIYTLTLEERATCPTSCGQWRSCYGNKMNWSERLMHGAALEWRLGKEIAALNTRHAGGFIVRLHVLGDFYSTAYVKRWLSWLRRFPALHIFGYTAWQPDTAIGALIADARNRLWDRFAVRTSNGAIGPRAVVLDKPQAGIITCPAQTSKTECCGTCGLCWGTRRDIAFLHH